MARRRKKRQAARWRPAAHNLATKTLGRARYRRALRYEPLEDRRLLAVVTVDTVDDVVDFNDGLVSLREAIFATNTVPGPDTIQFAPALNAGGPATILLTQGELAITDDLTIEGPGANLLKIDASGNDPTPDIDDGQGSRVFLVNNQNVATSIDVSIAGLTLTGGDTSRTGGAIYTTEDLSLEGMWILNNSAGLGGPTDLSFGGGIGVVAGTLSIRNSLVSGNSAVGQGFGGGIDANSLSTVAIENCKIFDNFAGSNGGGMRSSASQLEVVASEISGNRAGTVGGGLDLRTFTSGPVYLRNSLVSDNWAYAMGGGIYTTSSNLQIQSCTISGNQTHGFGGGLAVTGGNADRVAQITHTTITENVADGIAFKALFAGRTPGGGILQIDGSKNVELGHSIVATNQGPAGTFSDLSLLVSPIIFHNLIGDNTGLNLDEAPLGSPDANGNLIGGPVHGVIDRLLGPLADNGGPTLTHALLPGSPAINAGDLNAKAGVGEVPLFDQRGMPFDRIVGDRIDIGAFEYQTPTDLNLLVDTLVDESDGDYSRGDLSLREAIKLANASNYAGVVDTIRFDPALTAGGPAAILLTQGELQITDDLTIEGPGADLLTIDASGNDPTPDIDDGQGSRVFNIDNFNNSLNDVSLSGMTLTGADFGGSGGAISTRENLTLDSMVLTANAALEGGGVYASLGDLTISSSLFTENVAVDGSGAAILHNGLGALGDLRLVDTTVTANRLASKRGTVVTAQSVNATFTRSSISNNVLAGTGTDQPYALLASVRNLLIEDCTIDDNQNASGLRIASETAFQVLNSSVSGNDGSGMVITGASGNVDCTTINGNGDSGIRSTSQSSDLTINHSTISGNTGKRAGGIDFRGQGAFTLSDSEVSGNIGRGSSPGNYNAAGGMFLDVWKVTISRSSIFENTAEGETNSSGGGGVYIEGNAAYEGFAEVTIVDSVIRDNSAFSGGGILATASADISILRSTISGNEAQGMGGGILFHGDFGTNFVEDRVISNNRSSVGGGIVSLGRGGGNYASELLLVDSTVADNSAVQLGGGVYARAAQIEGTTISHNAAEEGGGVWLQDGTILHSTIATNSAALFGGGLFLESGQLLLNHTIVAANTAPAGRDLTGLLGTAIDAHYSLVGSNANSGLAEAPVDSPDANGNLIGGPIHGAINPRLGPLADNGGPTPTHMPLPGSPAINAGDPSATPGEGGVPVYDQRGKPFTRVYGGRIDIGAVERLPSGVLPGDFNRDGIVDGLDYGVWRDEVEATGHRVEPLGSAVQADGNGDGAVDERDFLVWRNNYGATQADLPGPFHVVPLAAMAIERAAPTISTSLSEVSEPLALATTSFVGGGDDSGPIVARRAGRATAPRVDPGVAAQQDRLLASWAATLRGSDHRSNPSVALTRTMRHTDDATEAVAVDSVFSRWNAATSGRVAGKLRVRAL